MNSDDRLREAVYDALMKIAEDTGEHPAAVLLAAFTTSVATLTALQPGDGNRLNCVYQLALKAGHELRQELNRQARAEQTTMTA